MKPAKDKPTKSLAPRSRKTKTKFGVVASAASSTRVGWVYRSDRTAEATPPPQTTTSGPVESAAPDVPAAIVTPPAPVSQPPGTSAPQSLAVVSADILLMPVSLSLMMIMAPLSWLSPGRRPRRP